MTEERTVSQLGSVLDCSPSLAADVDTVSIDGDFVYTLQGLGAAAIDRFVAAVVLNLDGQFTVRELADELSKVIAEPAAEVRNHVALGIVRMAQYGVLDGIDPQALLPQEEQPGGVVTETLPDGGKMMSVTLEFSTTNPAEREQVARVLSGGMSELDLVPSDSCVGQKLRVGQPADRWVAEVAGRTIAVRCDHWPTSELLLEAMRPAQGGEGATMAIVTGPLEGVGPPRVYDVLGQRVGRPRDGAAAARLVGHLLNEHEVSPNAGLVEASATVVESDGRCVLLPAGLIDKGRVLSVLSRAGMRPIPTRRVLISDSEVTVEATFGELEMTAQVAGLMVPDERDGLSPRTRAVVQLRSNYGAPVPLAAPSNLERTAQLVRSGCLPLHPVPRDERRLVETISRLLHAS